MKVSIAGQYQGETDLKTAKETKRKYPETVIKGRCILCGKLQEIRTPADECEECGACNWK